MRNISSSALALISLRVDEKEYIETGGGADYILAGGGDDLVAVSGAILVTDKNPFDGK